MSSPVPSASASAPTSSAANEPTDPVPSGSVQEQVAQMFEQITWLTKCIYIVQEQNKQLYDEVAALRFATDAIIREQRTCRNNSNCASRAKFNSLAKSRSSASRGFSQSTYPDDNQGGGSGYFFSPSTGSGQRQSAMPLPSGSNSCPVRSVIKYSFKDNSKSKSKSLTEEDLAVYKKWGSRGVPSYKGKPIDPDKLAALCAKPSAKCSGSANSNQGSTHSSASAPQPSDQAGKPSSGSTGSSGHVGPAPPSIVGSQLSGQAGSVSPIADGPKESNKANSSGQTSTGAHQPVVPAGASSSAQSSASKAPTDSKEIKSAHK